MIDSKGVLSRPSKRQYNESAKNKQAEHEEAMDRALDENSSRMTAGQKKKAMTQKELGMSENTYSQLVDRIETNSFQG